MYTHVDKTLEDDSFVNLVASVYLSARNILHPTHVIFHPGKTKSNTGHSSGAAEFGFPESGVLARRWESSCCLLLLSKMPRIWSLHRVPDNRESGGTYPASRALSSATCVQHFA